jgi:hypothetical protein
MRSIRFSRYYTRFPYTLLDDEDAMPVEIAEVLGEKIDARHSEMTRGRCGSDGI